LNRSLWIRSVPGRNAGSIVVHHRRGQGGRGRNGTVLSNTPFWVWGLFGFVQQVQAAGGRYSVVRFVGVDGVQGVVQGMQLVEGEGNVHRLNAAGRNFLVPARQRLLALNPFLFYNSNVVLGTKHGFLIQGFSMFFFLGDVFSSFSFVRMVGSTQGFGSGGMGSEVVVVVPGRSTRRSPHGRGGWINGIGGGGSGGGLLLLLLI